MLLLEGKKIRLAYYKDINFIELDSLSNSGLA